MDICLRNDDFILLQGRREGADILPEGHEALLGAALPEKWHSRERLVFTLEARAEPQLEARLEFCAALEEAPLLSLYYRILPGCRVQLPFPIDQRALGADMAFLPPWPGVFKGGVAGRPIQAEEARFFRLRLREASLCRVTVFFRSVCQRLAAGAH